MHLCAVVWTLTKNVLAVDVVLHLEAGAFHCEINVDFFDFHIRNTVTLHHFAVHFGNRTDVRCENVKNMFLQFRSVRSDQKCSIQLTKLRPKVAIRTDRQQQDIAGHIVFATRFHTRYTDAHVDPKFLHRKPKLQRKPPKTKTKLYVTKYTYRQIAANLSHRIVARSLYVDIAEQRLNPYGARIILHGHLFDVQRLHGGHSELRQALRQIRSQMIERILDACIDVRIGTAARLQPNG